jgi:hypothetical protein
MAHVVFTPHLARHVACLPCDAPGRTVREVLQAVFADKAELRSYLLDDQDRLRQHIAVFVDGRNVIDRNGLSDAVQPVSEVLVMQALSGG